MSRIRLTITLEQKILRFLDTIIDKKKIRNRSHAIEYVLKQYFDPQITKALVLVGGESDSSGQPFSMLKIAGKPTIGHIVEKLAQAGISHVVISLGKEGEKISKYLGDGSKWGVNITYINQKDPGFGTARALFEARQFFHNQPFVLWYGDILADIDLEGLVHTHVNEGKPVTVALTSVSEPEGWGVVQLRGLDVVDLEEKPEKGTCRSYVINAGISVVDPLILDRLRKNSRSFEREILSKLAEGNELCGYVFAGKWFDIGTDEGYSQAKNIWN